MNNKKPTTIKELYKGIKLLPLFLMGGMMLMCLVVAFLKRGDDAGNALADLDYIFVLIITSVAATSAVSGSFLFRKRVSDAVGKPLVDKLVIYRQATILRFALLEFPGIIGIVFFFLTNNYLFMVVTSAMLLFMVINRPTDDMIAQHLNLTEKDKGLLL